MPDPIKIGLSVVPGEQAIVAVTALIEKLIDLRMKTIDKASPEKQKELADGILQQEIRWMEFLERLFSIFNVPKP